MKMDESLRPDAMTEGESHSTLVTKVWEEPVLRFTRFGVPDGFGKGRLCRVQWLPVPSRVCSPSEVPIAKCGFGPVGHGDEHHSDGTVGIRSGCATERIS